MALSFLILLLLPPLFFIPLLAHSLPILFPRAPQSLLTKLSESNKYPNLPYTAHYFPQQLDHFSYQPKSYTIFYQKYLMNSTFWERGEPIFVYTGNEGDIEWFAANTGFMMDIAPKFRALLVFIEHRYYGTSKPFGEKSYESADKLGYLNSAQALADYAVLIRSLKQNMSAESSPVVAFGGSYGGMLAAWFRLKYPQIAIGALASSAPILQFDDITPWSSFYDAVSQDYKIDLQNTAFTVQLGCGANIQLANAIIDTGDAGATIQFGSVDFPAVAARVVTVPMYDNNFEGFARTPHPTKTTTHRVHLPAQRSTAVVENPRRRISIFERLSQPKILTTKRVVTGGKTFMVTANTIAPPTSLSTYEKDDVEASSSGGRLIWRQRRKLNTKL